MFRSEAAFYLGEQKDDGYSGVVFQDNLFFCLEIESGVNKEKGYEILDFVKKKIKEFFLSEKKGIRSLSDFDDFISLIIREKNLPLGFSLSAGYLKEKILYLKTIGQGKIYIRRKGKMGLLIDGDNTASGIVEDKDVFIFLTNNFFQLIGGWVGLEKSFNNNLKVNEVVNEITPVLKEKKDLGAVALFVGFYQEIDNSDIFSFQDEKKQMINTSSLNFRYFDFLRINFSSIWFSMKNSKKTLTFLTVFILFLIFFWSVILGFKRRINYQTNEKIKTAEELITEKLGKAEEVAFLNMDRALILITEAKQELEKVKKELEKGKIKTDRLEEIEKIIKDKENKILKKDLKSYQEFFDLAIDDKDAKGDRLYLVDDKLIINDKKKGVLYSLSLEKKSLSKDQFSQIKQADLIAGYKEEKFFYVKGGGVYRIDNEGKLKKVIDNDKNWGEIVDFNIYNGNIYLLDKKKDEIWKYLKGEENYSSPSSYFQPGQAIDLDFAYSMAIDGSIYLAGKDLFFKYTSGLRDSFSIDLPDKKAFFNKVFTSKDLEKIYLWDKTKEVVYVLGKNGDYLEQINSQILSKAIDIVVYKEKIYVLTGEKIYRID